MLYTSTKKYIDKETGEKLTAKRAKNYYIKIKTTKHGTTNWIEGKCHIEYTITCERNKQGKLFN